MKSLWKSLILLTFILSCVPLALAEDKIVKIGFAGPLTGPQTAIGADEKNAAEMAIEEANEAKVIPWVSLVLEALDDKADPKEAVSVAHRFAAENDVVAVIGHTTSGCSMPASSVYHAAGLTMITPSSTNPKLTQQGFENVFRVSSQTCYRGSLRLSSPSRYWRKRGSPSSTTRRSTDRGWPRSSGSRSWPTKGSSWTSRGSTRVTRISLRSF